MESRETRVIALSDYRLIEIEGLDAEKYLQGQLTTDVVKLSAGEQTLSCHCDPKGKISALFRLFKQSQTHFSALIHQSLLPEALTQLKKYAVFSKVTFTEQSAPLWGVLGDVPEAWAEHCLALDETRVIGFGFTPETAEIAPCSEWDWLEIAAGVPILTQENQAEHIPQALNVQQIEQAISFSKGCYVGQETVARAKYRGANKRAMFVLRGDNPQAILPKAGEALEMQLGENWRKSGVILTALQRKGALWLEVVLNKEIEPESRFRLSEAPEVQLTIQPLPYALEA